MTAGSIYDFNNGTEPQGQEQAPPIIDSKVVRILEEFAHKVEREGDKATKQLARRYGHNLSQRIPDIAWGTPGRDVIAVQRGVLGRRDATDLARQRAAKTIEDLTKLAAYLQANQKRFGEFGHWILTESKRNMAERNYLLPEGIREFGQLVELICSDRLLSTYEECMDMIKDIGMSEIARAMPNQNQKR
jgi:hypothetical protein